MLIMLLTMAMIVKMIWENRLVGLVVRKRLMETVKMIVNNKR